MTVLSFISAKSNKMRPKNPKSTQGLGFTVAYWLVTRPCIPGPEINSPVGTLKLWTTLSLIKRFQSHSRFDLSYLSKIVSLFYVWLIGILIKVYRTFIYETKPWYIVINSLSWVDKKPCLLNSRLSISIAIPKSSLFSYHGIPTSRKSFVIPQWVTNSLYQ